MRIYITPYIDVRILRKLVHCYIICDFIKYHILKKYRALHDVCVTSCSMHIIPYTLAYMYHAYIYSTIH